VVLLSSGTKTASNLDALDKLSAAADEKSGVVRFDTYEEMLKPTPSITFPAMKLFTYTVFKDQMSLRAWKKSMGRYLHNFDSDELAFSQPGLKTETANEITPQTEANPIFFWAYVDDVDFTTTRDAFAKINVPTRDEAGSIRYENSCTKRRSRRKGRPFCFENVWYDTLPSAQDAHMSTPHMGVFFGDTASVVIEWGMSTLKLLSTQAPSSVMEPLPVPQSSDTVSGFIQYLRIEEHATIISTNPDCDFWRAEDLGKKVPDKCCDLAKWPAGSGASQTPPSSRAKDTDPRKWACYVLQRVPPNDDTYTRNYLGCEAGVLVAAEGCAPTGTAMGNGYPMNETFAAASWIDGTFDSCNCEEPAMKGNGCYVAATSFMKGLGSDTFANFAHVGNDDCATATVN